MSYLKSIRLYWIFLFYPYIVTINDTDRNIYELIKYNPKISYSQIASILKVSRKTVSRYIASLRERGLIQFDGYPRSGKWIVIKEYSKESDKTWVRKSREV